MIILSKPEEICLRAEIWATSINLHTLVALCFRAANWATVGKIYIFKISRFRAETRGKIYNTYFITLCQRQP